MYEFYNCHYNPSVKTSPFENDFGFTSHHSHFGYMLVPISQILQWNDFFKTFMDILYSVYWLVITYTYYRLHMNSKKTLSYYNINFCSRLVTRTFVPKRSQVQLDYTSMLLVPFPEVKSFQTAATLIRSTLVGVP